MIKEIELLVYIHSNGDHIESVFKNYLLKGNYQEIRARDILAQLNKFASKKNTDIIQKRPGE